MLSVSMLVALVASIDRPLSTRAYEVLQFGWMAWAAFGGAICGAAWAIHPAHNVRMHALTLLYCWLTVLSGFLQLKLIPVMPHLGSNIGRFAINVVLVTVCIYFECTSERAWSARQRQRIEDHERDVRARAEAHAAEVLAQARRLVEQQGHDGAPL